MHVMRHGKNKKIYSINFSLNAARPVEIETVILNGLYRFSILGISQKNSSDIKDRVYSALRAEKLINLKSDNRKITTSLLPAEADKKPNAYDLGIALGCLVQMDKISIATDIFAIGELSITGNVLTANHIFKSICQSIHHGLSTIVCSHEDIEALKAYEDQISETLSGYDLKFVSGKTLSELVDNLVCERYYIPGKDFDAAKSKYSTQPIDIEDKNIFKIILALCTGKNIFIENKKDSYVKKFIKNIMYYRTESRWADILEIANRTNKTDDHVLKQHSYPNISVIDGQVEKDDLIILLRESFLGFNLIEDFISLPEETLYLVKKNHTSPIISFYNSCPCGNSNIFFNSIEDDKCLCLQRNILKYRQKILRRENGFFDFYIKNIDKKDIEFTPFDYINIGNIICLFKNNSVTAEKTGEIERILDRLGSRYEKPELDTIISTANDIAKLEHMLYQTKKPMLQSRIIDLAVEFTRRDF